MPKKPPLTVVTPIAKGRGAAQPPAKKKRRRADWQAVERDYRTGKFTLRELEAQHGVSAGQISRKAKEKGWTQDLRAVIKQATNNALLLQNATRTQQEAAEHNNPSVIATVLAAAEMNKQVILRHREDIEVLRGTTMKAVVLVGQQVEAMLRQADAAAGKPDARLPDPAGVLLAAQRASQSLARLQAMERKAFGLDEDEDPASKNQGAQNTLTDAARAARIAKLFQMAGSAPAGSNDGAPHVGAA